MVDGGLKRLLKVFTKGAAHVAAANLEKPKPLTDADKVDVGVKLTKKIFGRYFDKGGDTTQKKTKRRSKRSTHNARDGAESPTHDRRSEGYEADDSKRRRRRRQATATEQFEQMSAPDDARHPSDNKRRQVVSDSRPPRGYNGSYHEPMKNQFRPKRSSDERRPNAEYPETSAERQSHKPDTKTPRSPDGETRYRRSSHGGPTSPQSTGPTKKHRRRNSHHEGRTGNLDTEVPVRRTHSQRNKPTSPQVPISPIDTSQSRHSKAGESPREPRHRGGIEATEDQRCLDDRKYSKKTSGEVPKRRTSQRDHGQRRRRTSGLHDEADSNTSTTAVLEGERPMRAGPRIADGVTDERADRHKPVSPSKSRRRKGRGEQDGK